MTPRKLREVAEAYLTGLSTDSKYIDQLRAILCFPEAAGAPERTFTSAEMQEMIERGWPDDREAAGAGEAVARSEIITRMKAGREQAISAGMSLMSMDEINGDAAPPAPKASAQALTWQQLGELLVQCGLIHQAALDNPAFYDDHTTTVRIGKLLRLLGECGIPTEPQEKAT